MLFPSEKEISEQLDFLPRLESLLFDYKVAEQKGNVTIVR